MWALCIHASLTTQPLWCWGLQLELRKVRNLHERELKLLHGRLQRLQSFELEIASLKRELELRTRDLHNARKSARVHSVEVRASGCGCVFCKGAVVVRWAHALKGAVVVRWAHARKGAVVVCCVFAGKGAVVVCCLCLQGSCCGLSSVLARELLWSVVSE